MNTLGYPIDNVFTLKLILPIGISFYTFQTISYSLDIYWKQLKPTKSFISFAAFVSFFPQLVAGPIERAKNLLPQISSKRTTSASNIINGLQLIIWGLFKKVVIADSLGSHVDIIFNNYQNLNGGILFIGIVYFSFQLYCDFSGYSDIAIGTAKLFGFELMSNFRYPFFASNPIDFWNRWHISLSSWVKDYLYSPLALFFLRKFKHQLMNYIPHFLTMVIIGFWHGANWTFIFFGLYWGIISCLYLIISKNVIKNLFLNKHLSQFLSRIVMFIIASFGFLLFRSPTMNDAYHYFYFLFKKFQIPNIEYYTFTLILFILLFDWIHKDDERAPLNFKKTIYPFKNQQFNYLKILTYFSINFILFWSILVFTFKNNNQFIYFQF